MKYRKLYLVPFVLFSVVIALAVTEQRHLGDAIVDTLPADGISSEFWGNVGYFLIVGLLVLEYVQVLWHQCTRRK